MEEGDAATPAESPDPEEATPAESPEPDAAGEEPEEAGSDPEESPQETPQETPAETPAPETPAPETPAPDEVPAAEEDDTAAEAAPEEPPASPGAKESPASRAEPNSGPAEAARSGDLRSFLQDGALARSYSTASALVGRKASKLVERCLWAAAEEGGETFSIEAPGNHKHAFTSRLNDQDMAAFAKVFTPPAPFLVRLDLSYNLLTDAGAEVLASSLVGAQAERLAVLSLRSNSIGPKGGAAICRAARDCPNLRRLDVAQNPLGRVGGMPCADLLRDRPLLMELMLGDTEMDIHVLVALTAALLLGTSRLRVFDIENPRLTTLQEEHVVHLGRVLRVNTYMSELYLGKNRMRDEGIRQLVSFLLENKTLRVLDLRCNEIGAAGAQHLGTLLASDCQLSQLNLSGNRVGERDNVDGAKALGEALLQNRMLQHLDLNHNELCGKALFHLADAMDKNSTLETLALFHNHWDQLSSYRFHQVLGDRARMLPLRADFVTTQVDLRIDVCKLGGF